MSNFQVNRSAVCNIEQAFSLSRKTSTLPIDGWQQLLAAHGGMRFGVMERDALHAHANVHYIYSGYDSGYEADTD